MEKIERDGIHPIFIQVVEHTKGVPIARAARFDDRGADLAITQINHQPLRRNIEDFSSIFSRGRPLCYLRGQMQTAPAPADSLTVVAIGILAYMLGDVLHEGLGHGGACVLAGGKPLVLSSVAFECSSDTRLVMAGGTLINLVAAAIFFTLGRLTNSSYPRFKYFFWISMTVNLFSAAGYFLFSGIGGIGDWRTSFKDLAPSGHGESPWRSLAQALICSPRA